MFAHMVSELGVSGPEAKTIGEWVKRARLNMGLHQDVLAVLLGVHSRTVSKWERDVLTPSDLQLDLIWTFWQAKLRKWPMGHGWGRAFEHAVLDGLGLRRSGGGSGELGPDPYARGRLSNATPSGSSLVAVLRMLLDLGAPAGE